MSCLFVLSFATVSLYWGSFVRLCCLDLFSHLVLIFSRAFSLISLTIAGRSKFNAMRDAAGGGCCGCRWKNVSALMSRGAKRMLRNWTFLLFTFLVPALQVILFCVAIGQQPKGLHLAVVNQDAGIDAVPTIFGPLPLPAVNLGNQFLTYLDSASIVQDSYNSSDLALAAVRRGDAWGVLYLTPTFTESTFLRYIPGFNVTEPVLQASTVFLNLDMTNQQIFVFMQDQISTAYDVFLHAELEFLVALGIKLNPREVCSLTNTYSIHISPSLLL